CSATTRALSPTADRRRGLFGTGELLSLTSQHTPAQPTSRTNVKDETLPPILLLRDKIGPLRRLSPIASGSSRARHGCFLTKAERAKGRAESVDLIAREQAQAEKLARDALESGAQSEEGRYGALPYASEEGSGA